ncbi:MAG: DNA polymerase III subunit beta [Porphyromonas sp.]|nr:DNA polymerase III subunit beta [Porphyromonas sp.]
MKFTVSCAELTTLLQHVVRGIPSGSISLPILSQFLIEIKDGVLKATGADKTLRVSGSIALISSDGDKSFTVTPGNILEYVRALPEQPLVCEIIADENYEKMIISHQGGFSEFAISDAALYPSGFESDNKDSGEETSPRSLSVISDTLLMGIASTLPAVSTDANRPIMTGIYFDVTDSGLVLVSTDSKVLTKFVDKDAKISMEQSDAVYHKVNGFSLIAKTCSLLKSLLSAFPGEEVMVEYTNVKARFTFGSYEVVSLLNIGVFPNYNSVIPNNPYKLTVDKAELQIALRRIGRSFSASSLVIVLLVFKDDIINLSSHSMDLSVKSEEIVSADMPSELTGMKICFDGKTLATQLSVFPSKTVDIYLADQTRAAFIAPSESDLNVELCSIVLPLKMIGEV